MPALVDLCPLPRIGRDRGQAHRGQIEGPFESSGIQDGCLRELARPSIIGRDADGAFLIRRPLERHRSAGEKNGQCEQRFDRDFHFQNLSTED
ncbi:hypothetical protein D9M72_585170 [compost metagenome]